MSEIPIIMSGSMVRALLREIAAQGTGKTQTRRLAWRECQNAREAGRKNVATRLVRRDGELAGRNFIPTIWQKVRPGDRLYVREKHWCVEIEDGGIGVPYLCFDEEWTNGPGARMPAPAEERPWFGPPYFDDENQEIRWGARPSIHMPRWASRLTLDVTETRMQRLQNISRNDAIAEGIASNPVQPGTWIDYPEGTSAAGWKDSRLSFASLWESLHKPGQSWIDNPEVVALTFTVHQRNIDREAA